jgi:NMT1-like family
LLKLNGVDEHVAEFLSLPADQAAAALLRGDIEAMMTVASWDTPVVRTLLASSEISLANFPRADAYVALYPYLTKLLVPTGVGNMATNRPPSDVTLLAPKAELVVRNDLHPAIEFLLLQAATEVHSDPGIFQKAGEFPAAEQADLPLSPDARQFYKSGGSFLQRYLPFWLAVLASRLLVLLIPLMGVAYPLLRIAPALYGWSMRRRIFRLYGELKLIERDLETQTGRGTQEVLQQLLRLEDRANRQHVPVGFAHFLYQLRNHIGLVRARLLEHPRSQP